MTPAPRTISIFGTSKAIAGDKVFETAYDIGKSLAGKGFVIANGGYGGTMLAAAKGASEAGGEVTGVTCAAFGRKGANEFVSKEIHTASLGERLKTLVELGDGYIVLMGGTGTLLELADVWEHKNKGFISEDKPVIIVGQFWKGLVETIGEIDANSAGCVEVVEDANEAVEKIAACFSG